MGERIQKERSFRQVWVFARRHAAIVHLASARRRGRYNCPEGQADIAVAGESHSSCSLRPNLPIRGTLRSECVADRRRNLCASLEPLGSKKNMGVGGRKRIRRSGVACIEGIGRGRAHSIHDPGRFLCSGILATQPSRFTRGSSNFAGS